MKRYKIFLARGGVLEIEARSARLEYSSPSEGRLCFRGDKNQVVFEFWLAHLAGYGETAALISEEAS